MSERCCLRYGEKKEYGNKLPAGHGLHDVFQPFVFSVLNFAQGVREVKRDPKGAVF